MTNLKIYTQKLDIIDVNEIYNIKEKSCMNKLKKDYVGRCLKGAYILEIISLLETSYVKISLHHSDVRGMIDVMFQAKIFQYQKNDLIANCKIVAKKGNRIFANTEHGQIMLLNHDILKTVDKGDMMPVIVREAKYPPLKHYISIFAKPYIPTIPITSYIYVLEESMSSKNVEKIGTYLNDLAKLKKWITELTGVNAKKFMKFDEIFYPFKTQKKPKLLSINKKISTLDITTIKYDKFNEGIIIPSCEISKSKLFVLYADISARDSIKTTINTLGEDWNMVRENTFVVFESLLLSFIKHLLFLKEMVTLYDMPKDTAFWKSLREHKQK